MHSVLGWDSFCMNDCISAMWQGVSQPSPAEGDEAQVAVISTISSSHCWVSCLSSSSWQYPRHFNPMVTKPGFGTFGSVGRCQILLDNEISISMKLVSKCDAGRQLRWPWPWPNTVDQSQQMTCSPNQHWLWKPDTGLQATWILCLSIPPPDSGTLISKGNERQSTERQSSSLAWVRLFWHCFWFRSGLYTRIAVTVGSPCPGSVRLTPASVHSLWSSHTFLTTFACYGCLCILFFHTFTTHSTFYEYAWIQALWTASFFSDDLWGLACLWRVLMTLMSRSRQQSSPWLWRIEIFPFGCNESI